MIDAPGLGRLWIAWSPVGLTRLSFIEADDPPEPLAPLPKAIAEPLGRYFEGRPVDPASLPVQLTGTRFQREVYQALRRVPRGSVRTYSGLAIDVGSPRAMRAIGQAMAANPIAIVVPCHRVVGAGLALGGFSGGLDRKRALLELEGVKVEGDRVLPGQLDLIRPG